jgi:hypothetical protein
MANNILKNYPIRRISPEDGMAVTAQVWGEAHNYHDLRQRYGDLLQHGSGIITGLEVSPSERPLMVDLKPGMAIDPEGDMIVVSETKSYQMGTAPGLQYLILSYGESTGAQEANGPRFIRSECILQAVAELPAFPFIEVARIQIAAGTSIRAAMRPELPAPGELDLRFRPYALVQSNADTQIARIGVCYSAKEGHSEEDGHGALWLARALRAGGKQVWVDDDIPLEGKDVRLEAYTLIYLVGEDQFQLNEREAAALKAAVQKGGTLLVEPCRKYQPTANSAAAKALLTLAGTFGTQLIPPVKGHTLFTTPHLFSATPPGFDTEDDPKLLLAEGVIFSACDYGCLWRGERRGRLATREEIRTAEEWGENLLAYAAGRRAGGAR